MIRLAETRGSREGVYCGVEGLFLGSASLIELRDGHCWLRAEEEIAALLSAAYDEASAAPRVAAALPVVAAALDENDLAWATHRALQIGLGLISEEGMRRIAHADELAKYNFNPLEPRGRHGRWIPYGSSSPLLPVSARRPTRGGAPSDGRAWERLPNAEFRNRLAVNEQSADKPNFGYSEVNAKTDALGRYQMTPGARTAAGITDAQGKWTGRYGIHSRAQFLADHEAQEKVLTDLLRATERQLRANGSFSYAGSTIDGLEGRFTITRAGLIAAAHREGARATFHYLQRVAHNGFRSRGLAVDDHETAIETRLRTFADVPYE